MIIAVRNLTMLEMEAWRKVLLQKLLFSISTAH